MRVVFKNVVLSVIAVVAVFAILYPLAIEPWHLGWGATVVELKKKLPGDDVASHPKIESTRAITIDVPAEKVWPWLVQMGQGRGGLYSYDWLENLAGCDIHSADRINPEWQNLKVGDFVRFGPEGSGYPQMPVYRIEPNKVLILGGFDKKTGFGNTWVFYLNEVDENTSRLIVRSRYDYESSVGNFIVWRVVTAPLQFLMERKMLSGIKERAEASAR